MNTHQSTIALFLILTFAVACGKDEGNVRADSSGGWYAARKNQSETEADAEAKPDDGKAAAATASDTTNTDGANDADTESGSPADSDSGSEAATETVASSASSTGTDSAAGSDSDSKSLSSSSSSSNGTSTSSSSSTTTDYLGFSFQFLNKLFHECFLRAPTPEETGWVQHHAERLNGQIVASNGPATIIGYFHQFDSSIVHYLNAQGFQTRYMEATGKCRAHTDTFLHALGYWDPY